jgi:branched-chain amino acid transport system substrate-binding protein
MFVLVAASCGTRVDDPAAAAPGAGGAAVSVATPLDTTGQPAAADVTVPDASGAVPAAAATPGAPVPAGPGAGAKAATAASTPGQTSAAGATAAAGPAPAQGAAASPGAQTTAAAPASAPAAKGAPAVATPGTKSPIKLGLVGSISGPVSQVTKPQVDGPQVWAKWVNSRGGINGHPVELLVADDGGERSRHVAAVKELVERQKVIAFLNNVAIVAGDSSVAYLEEKRIPTIGISGGEAWAYDSPMIFPQGSSGVPLGDTLFGAAATPSLKAGKKNLAVIACSEVQLCRDIYDSAEAQSKRFGMNLVHRARASLAQPDFTAECLAAQNAGADTIIVASDTPTFRRIVTACARQNYRPLMGLPGQGVFDDMRKLPELQDIFYANLTTFPFFQNNTPATAEFHQAMKTFGGGLPLATGQSTGWTAGKLFEKVAANMPEPPTSEAVLEGAWSIRNDDLGGLTHPLTFVKDQKPVPSTCWFNIAIVNNEWTSPDGFKLECK